MSADNFLVTIPAKGNKIALYEVSASDAKIDLEDVEIRHEVCRHIHDQYADRLLDVFDDEVTIDAYAAQYMLENTVEYGLTYLHTR